MQEYRLSFDRIVKLDNRVNRLYRCDNDLTKVVGKIHYLSADSYQGKFLALRILSDDEPDILAIWARPIPAEEFSAIRHMFTNRGQIEYLTSSHISIPDKLCDYANIGNTAILRIIDNTNRVITPDIQIPEQLLAWKYSDYSICPNMPQTYIT